MIWIQKEIQFGSNDTQFNKYFKLFIFTYTSDFLNVNPHLRGTFLIFMKNIFLEDVLIFLVEYFFASVKLFQKNVTPLSRTVFKKVICILYVLVITCNRHCNYPLYTFASILITFKVRIYLFRVSLSLSNLYLDLCDPNLTRMDWYFTWKNCISSIPREGRFRVWCRILIKVYVWE